MELPTDFLSLGRGSVSSTQFHEHKSGWKGYEAGKEVSIQ